MKELNDNKTRETWEGFINKHGLKIKEREIRLFPVANKGQLYLTIEKTDDCFIFYKYLYYKFDPGGYGTGNYFKISIPVDTKEEFLIRRPRLMSRLFFGDSIRIILENRIEIHKSLREYISERFNRFSDLRIRTTQYSFHEFGLPQRDLKTLEIHTKKLPTDVIELDSLRDLTLKVFSYFRQQNLIKPLTNIE